MKNYNIEVSQVRSVLFQVNANSKKEARAMVDNLINTMNTDLFKLKNLKQNVRFIIKNKTKNRMEVKK